MRILVKLPGSSDRSQPKLPPLDPALSGRAKIARCVIQGTYHYFHLVSPLRGERVETRRKSRNSDLRIQREPLWTEKLTAASPRSMRTELPSPFGTPNSGTRRLWSALPELQSAPLRNCIRRSAPGCRSHRWGARRTPTPLQCRPTARLDRLPGSRPGSVRAHARRMAGCASATGSATHASAGASTSPKITSQVGHPVGGGHLG